MSTTAEKQQAHKMVGNCATYVLHDIVDGWRADESAVVRVAARRELVRRHACLDCGAAAGMECKPDYGCRSTSRRYAPAHIDVSPA